VREKLAEKVLPASSFVLPSCVPPKGPSRFKDYDYSGWKKENE